MAYHAQGYTYDSWPGLLVSDYDEGAYVISAQLLDHGYQIFSQVFSSQPAAFLGSLWGGIHLLHGSVDSMVAGHLVIAFFGALAVLGTAWVAWAAFGKGAAIAAAVALGVSPAFILFSHTIEAEVPMLGLSMLAVAAAQWYNRTSNRVYLVLSGLLLAGGLEMKVLAAVFVVPIALLVITAQFARDPERQSWDGATQGYVPVMGTQDNVAVRLTIDILLLILSTLVPLVIILGLFSPRDQWDQVVAFHLKASSVYPLEQRDNIRAIRDMLLWDPGILAAAAIGFLCVLVRRSLSGVIHLLWLLTTAAFLIEYHPLIAHQFVVLFPPLAVLAGAAAGSIFATRSRALLIPLGFLAIVAWAGLDTVQLPVVGAAKSGTTGTPSVTLSTWDRTQNMFLSLSPTSGDPLAKYTARMQTDTNNVPDCAATARAAKQDLTISTVLYRTLLRQCLAFWVDQHSSPRQFIVADDLFVATLAQRLVPPQLSDPSLVRASAGYLTEHQLEDYTRSANVALVVIWRGTFTDQSFYPGYVAWLRHNFKAVATGVPGSLVFQRV